MNTKAPKKVALLGYINYYLSHVVYEDGHMSKEFVVEVTENNDGESFIELPEEILNTFELKEGDKLLWKRIGDEVGYYLKKKKV